MLSAEKGLSKNTREAYCRDVELFFDHLKYVDSKTIGRHHIMDYLRYLKDEKKSQSTTLARHLSSLKHFFLF